MTPDARQRKFRLLMRIAISGSAFLVFALHVQGTLRWGLIDRIETYLYDTRVRWTMPNTVDERIAIIDVDEASLAIEGQWPWPRDRLAAMLDQLFDRYGVRLVAFDMYYPEPEERSALDVLDEIESSGQVGLELQGTLDGLRENLDVDRVFSESFIARDVVLGYVFKERLSAGEPEATATLPPPLFEEAEIEALSIPFIEAEGYVGNISVLQANALSAGFVDTPLIDADGIYRRAPLVQRYRGDLYASLALSVARQLLATPVAGFEFASGDPEDRTGLELEAFVLGDRRIPVDERASVLIPFLGPQESFPYVSATHVLQGTAAVEQLAGKIAIVGTSAAGLFDLRSTPVAERYIGVEAHANLIAGLLDGTIKQRPSYSAGLEIAILFVLGLITVLVLPRLSAFSSLGLLIGIFGLVSAVNFAIWERAGLVVPLAASLSYVLLTGLLQISYGYFVESRNKRRLSGFFGQYVPPELVAEMDAGGAEITLAGESRTMSVLFSDVRGFTTISEGLDAQELTQLMNEFLTPVTGVIHGRRGTIDKYMGDAVMAFWGAPLADPDHARNAVEAGMSMIETLRELRPQFEARGWPPLEIGVGVSTGEMNVGNMGSEFRMAYTVMGDTVNLGSRLEGLTKQYGVAMIVSEATARAVPEVAFRELDQVRVKGKTRPVAIFEPVAHVSELQDSQRCDLERFEAALSHYRASEWDESEALLEGLSQAEDRLIYRLYLDRIHVFKEAPPPENWDGVFVHETK